MRIHSVEDYEPIHFKSIHSLMKPGQTFYDIGVYDAITSVIIAAAVGAKNVVLIEPSEVNWANIREYWYRSGLRETPKATYTGFLGDQDSNTGRIFQNAWPPESEGPMRADEHCEFRHIFQQPGRPMMKLDTIAQQIGAPAGITMDVEGAEFLVLHGAQETLAKHHPLVWVSVHPQFMIDRYQTPPAALHDFMRNFGYRETLLVKDHEEHWLFQ